MQLVRRFPKGHAIPQPKVPWYESVVAYLILIPAVLSWFVGGPLLLTYWSCSGGARGFCSSDLLASSTGSYTGIVVAAAVTYLLALSFALATQFTVRKLHFVLVWSFALGCLLTSAYGLGVLSGMAGTPWGRLIPLT